jgi:predicted DsbA family dithiol-disulfide isomerase
VTTKLRVWSDYVCPFCLLAEKPLEQAVAGLDVEIEWMPFELRPYPVPTLRPEGEYLQRVWATSVYPLARRMRTDITLPDVSPQPYSRPAFEGYQYAREHGVGQEYTPRMLRAFFRENLDIGDLDVLTGVAGELGLDTRGFRTALEEGTCAEAHQAALEEAAALRITSVPTVIVADTYRIEGVPAAARLRHAIETAQAEAEAGPGTEEPGYAARCGIDGC